MEQNIQSSFIPKQVLTKEVRPRREPLGLFFLLSFVVLIIALLFFGGVYAYKVYLDQVINRPCPPANALGAVGGCGLLASLEVRRQSLNQPELILKIERLGKQLKRAAVLLDSHRTLVPIFQFLEDETLQSIRYSSFNQDGANLTLRGTARNYEGVALQSIAFSDNHRVKDFVFSDLNADAAGKVSFNLKLDLDPALISYAAIIIPPLP